MQPIGLLHKIFENESTNVHCFTLNNLLQCSITLTRINKLNLTSLGRNFSKKNKTRSNVKKVDRLLGNISLQNESVSFYKILNKFTVTENSTPWIHIDWSCICSTTNLYLLRASISSSGRSIVIYEECHPKKNENNHATHKNFLDNLKSLLPDSTKPIIVTDAGFRALWFSYILKLGWDFVGRVRNKNSVLLGPSSKWQLSSNFYEKATGVPTCIGHGILTESTKVPVNFVLYKGKSKKRHRVNKKENLKPGGMAERYSKAQKEPWLLATSLRGLKDLAIKTVNVYRQRMRIEENFRDTKCTRFGFGLKESRSRSTERMKILLLVAAIATFICWIAGIHGKNKGIASDFQVHSAKFKSLSIVYLGKEILKREFKITKNEFLHTLNLLFDLVINTQTEEHSYE
jgi:hypothetical protein